jgi:hypothetical protein
MESLPTASVDIEMVAVPPDKLAVPKVMPPSRNVTVPVAVPLTCGVTVAVKVTACPKVDGLMELETVVEVVAVATVCVIGADVLPLKLLSPPYTTVIVWLPADSVAVVKTAEPVPDKLAVPNVVEPPSRNVTLPVAVPLN